MNYTNILKRSMRTLQRLYYDHTLIVTPPLHTQTRIRELANYAYLFATLVPVREVSLHFEGVGQELAEPALRLGIRSIRATAIIFLVRATHGYSRCDSRA